MLRLKSTNNPLESRYDRWESSESIPITLLVALSIEAEVDEIEVQYKECCNIKVVTVSHNLSRHVLFTNSIFLATATQISPKTTISFSSRCWWSHPMLHKWNFRKCIQTTHENRVPIRLTFQARCGVTNDRMWPPQEGKERMSYPAQLRPEGHRHMQGYY